MPSPTSPDEPARLDHGPEAEGELCSHELVTALQKYRELLDEGQQPVRSTFLRQYPQIAGELAECLDSLDFLQNIAPQLTSIDEGGEPPRDETSALHVAIGDFRIIREIGRGGMGVVYEAEQLSLARRVALKVLPFAAVLDQRQLQRFKNEALAAAQLDHPNIVDVFGVGCDRGVHYYAMRYIEGHTLAELIQQLQQQVGQTTGQSDDGTTDATTPGESDFLAGPDTCDYESGPPAETPATPQLERTARTRAHQNTKAIASMSTRGSVAPPQRYRTVARLAVEIADALDQAHQQGVVHRDIKPSNLILDIRGKPWVTDFGLAQIETNQTLTITGDLVGTLRYMSPEQVLAKRVSIDHRTDIYSLGVSLYELITLQPAYAGDARQELLRKITFEEPTPARRVRRTVPPELETILLKAMAKNPDDRYATASELADDLRRFLADEPILAKRPSWVDHVAKWARRHRTAVLWALIALGAISVVSSVASIRMVTALQRAEEAENQLRQEKLSAEDREAQARRSEQIWSLLYRARGIRKSGWAGQRMDSLREIQQAANVLQTMPQKDDYLIQLRNESIACLALADLHRIKRLDAASEARSYVLGDQELTRYAYINEDNEVVVRRIDDERELFRTPPDETTRFAFPILSPNGRYLIIANDHVGECDVWDIDQQTRLFDRRLSCYRLAFDISGDSRWLACGGQDRRLRFYDLTSPATPPIEHDLSSVPTFVAVTPNGEQVAVCYEGGTSVELLSRQPEAPSGSYSTAPSMSTQVTFDPIGQHMAVGCFDGKIHVWDLASNQKDYVLAGHDATIVKLGYNPASNRLVSVSHDRTSVLWESRTGKQLVRSAGFVRNLGVGDQGILQSNATTDVFEITGGRCHRTLAGQLAGVSHDGAILAALDRGMLRIFDVATLRPLASLPVSARLVEFSPDAQALFTFSPRAGVDRWPIVRSPNGQVRRVGPPERISPKPLMDAGDACLSHNGRKLAWVTGRQEVTLVELKAEAGDPLTITTSNPVTAIALSPDGHQLAANAWDLSTGEVHGYEIWDLATRSLVRRLDGEGGSWWASLNYSHDGKWLVAGPESKSTEVVKWRVDTWDEVARIRAASGINDFSPDDRLLAVDDLQRNERVVSLWGLANHQKLAVLELPSSRQHHLFVERVCFGGDGGRLFAGDSSGVIHVWNLQLIRKHLSQMGLDWNHPAYPPLPPAADRPVEVATGGALLEQPHDER